MKKHYNIAYLTLECLHENSATRVHVMEIVQELQRQNLGVTLYSPHQLDNFKKIPLYKKLSNYLFVQLKLICKLKKYDLIYIRAHNMAFPVSIIAKLFSIPVIQEINGVYDDIFTTHSWLKIFKLPLVFFQRLQYKYAAHLLPVTNKLADWLALETCHNRITPISNGANIKLFHPNAINQSVDQIKSTYVIFYSSMAKWHDIETVVNSTYEPTWPRDIKLVIAGGNIRTVSNNYIGKINSNIIILGEKDYEQMPAYISKALAGLVVLKDWNGRSQKGLSPLKLYETLACGVPVIVSDFPGQADFVRSYNCGIVILPESSASLATAVAFLANNRGVAKELGDNGRKIVARDYSWRKISQDINAIIQQIICCKEK